jgi:hypothetical protein
MAGKILILRWAGSAAPDGLLELIAQELPTLGSNVVLFPAEGQEWPQRLIEVLKTGDIAFALTMSGIGIDLALNGTTVWEAAKVPLFNWNATTPATFLRAT